MIHIPFFSKDQEAPDLEDGLGQSTLTDLKWIKRFKTVSKQAIEWRAPNDQDRARFNDLPQLDKFGDFLLAASEHGDQVWLVVERTWHGWPDPPRFAFFAVEPDGRIWSAADFHHWPKNWRHEGITL